MTGPRSRGALVRRQLGVADRLEEHADHPDGDADPTSHGQRARS